MQQAITNNHEVCVFRSNVGAPDRIARLLLGMLLISLPLLTNFVLWTNPVLSGAAIVGGVVLKRPAPVLASSFALPANRKIDVPLVAGSAVFGIGWGIAGFCPGGAIPALGLGEPTPWLFVFSMIIGIVAATRARAAYRARAAATA